MLLGEPLVAHEALKLGLVNHVFLPSAASDEARQCAGRLAENPTSSLIETKKLLKQHQAAAAAERDLLEYVTIGKMQTEPADREAFAAFLEKRKLNFEGL